MLKTFISQNKVLGPITPSPIKGIEPDIISSSIGLYQLNSINFKYKLVEVENPSKIVEIGSISEFYPTSSEYSEELNLDTEGKYVFKRSKEVSGLTNGLTNITERIDIPLIERPLDGSFPPDRLKVGRIRCWFRYEGGEKRLEGKIWDSEIQGKDMPVESIKITNWTLTNGPTQTERVDFQLSIQIDSTSLITEVGIISKSWPAGIIEDLTLESSGIDIDKYSTPPIPVSIIVDIPTYPANTGDGLVVDRLSGIIARPYFKKGSVVVYGSQGSYPLVVTDRT